MTVSDEDLSALLDDEMLARRTKVMFLRNAGGTWPAIAKEVGVSPATCRKDYAVVCRDINAEQPANVVARHRAVIFDIQRANYPAMMRGDKDAAATILRAQEREARLLGLDSPTRILASVSTEEFANEAARLIASISEKDPAILKELTRVQSSAPTIIDAPATPFDRPRLVRPTTAGPAPAGATDPPPEPTTTTDEGDDDDDWSNI